MRIEFFKRSTRRFYKPDLLHSKQETADRSPEGGGDSCCGTCADEVPPVLGVSEPLEEGQVEAKGLGLQGDETEKYIFT